MTPEQDDAEAQEARLRLEKEVQRKKELEQAGLSNVVEKHEERIAEANASRNIISVAEAIKQTLPKFEEIAAKTKAFGDKLREELKTKPKLYCLTHEDQELAIHWDDTFGRSHRQGKLVPVYEPCPQCSNVVRGFLVNEKWKSRGVPEKVLHATLDNYVIENESQQKAITKIRAVLERGITFTIIRGTWGTGKSHMAAAMLKQAGDGLFVTLHDLIGELRKSYEEGGGEELVEKYRTCKVLVIDEISTEVKGVDIGPLLYRILGYRHDKGLKVVITSNEELKVILGILGGKISDRLRETHVIVTCEWESYRKKQ